MYHRHNNTPYKTMIYSVFININKEFIKSEEAIIRLIHPIY